MDKTLLVGFDAACWEYVDPLLRQDQLPNLKKLIDSGVSATLHSTMPPWTPAAWSSIVTGLQPGSHGIFDMLQRGLGDNELIPVTANQRVGTPFWEYLNRENISVGLVNVPFSFPLKSIDGFVLYGFGTPNNVKEFGFPAEAEQWMRQQVPEWQPTIDTEVYLTGTEQELFAAEADLQSKQVYGAIQLASQYDVQVLVINLMLLDHINHRAADMATVNEAMIRTDEHLGELLAEYQPGNVMLISDHGANRVRGEFWLYSWLQDEGYLVFEPRSKTDRSIMLNWILKQWLQGSSSWPAWAERIIRYVLKNSIASLPRAWQASLWRRIEAIIPEACKQLEWTKTLDKKRSPLLPGTIFSGLLYINPEYDGELFAGESNNWLDELVSKLNGFSDPRTGKSVFSDIHVRNDATMGPKIILDSFDSEWLIRLDPAEPLKRHQPAEYFVEPPSDFGWHSRDGLLVFSGGSFKQGKQSGDYYLPDLAATLLHLYDIPVPDSIDGQVMEPLLHENFLSEHTIRFQKGDELRKDALSGEEFSPSESLELIEHLRGLGYLD